MVYLELLSTFQDLIGCGPVSRPTRNFPYSPANYDFNANEPDVCISACSASGYAYASVSAARLCLCGISAASLGQLNSSSTGLCEVQLCTGNSNLFCGDLDYELVYMSMGVLEVRSIHFLSFIYGNVQFSCSQAISFWQVVHYQCHSRLINSMNSLSHIKEWSVKSIIKSILVMDRKQDGPVES